MRRFHIFLASVLVFISFVKSYGQDTLFKLDGMKLSTKVLEVGPQEIKYKLSVNPDGPLYVVSSSDVYLVKYQNGTSDTISKILSQNHTQDSLAGGPFHFIYRSGPFYTQDDNEFKEKDLYLLASKLNDQKINYHIMQAGNCKQKENIGFIAIPAMAFTVVYTIFTTLTTAGERKDENFVPTIIGGTVAFVSLGTAITFNIKKKAHNDEIVRLYNEKY